MSVYRPKGSKVYVMDFWIDGQRVHESTGMRSKTRAREVEDKRKQRIRDGEAGIRRPRKLGLFSTAAKTFRESHVSNITASANNGPVDEDERERQEESEKGRKERFDCSMKRLLPFFGHKLLVDIEARDIAKFQQARLAQGAANATVNHDVALLRQILRKNGLWSRIAPDVKMLPARRDVGISLSDDQERMLLLECKRSEQRLLFPFVSLLIATGARFTTIRRLRWKDVDFAKSVIAIGKDKTRAGTGRFVPLSSRASAVLQMVADRFPDRKPGHYVFASQAPRWMKNKDRKQKVIVVNPAHPFESIRRAWIAAKQRTGRHCMECHTGVLADVQQEERSYQCTSCGYRTGQLPPGLVGLRLHDLRHTAVSRMIEAKIPLPMIGKIVGWSPSTLALMIARYGHFSLDEMRAAVETISRGNGMPNSATSDDSGSPPAPIANEVLTVTAGFHSLLMAKYDRNELYEKVWTKPLKILAREYGVSDVALGKACRLLLIPLPGKGYWAKLAAGKPVPSRPPLPPPPSFDTAGGHVVYV